MPKKYDDKINDEFVLFIDVHKDKFTFVNHIYITKGTPVPKKYDTLFDIYIEDIWEREGVEDDEDKIEYQNALED